MTSDGSMVCDRASLSEPTSPLLMAEASERALMALSKHCLTSGSTSRPRSGRRAGRPRRRRAVVGPGWGGRVGTAPAAGECRPRAAEQTAAKLAFELAYG